MVFTKKQAVNIVTFLHESKSYITVPRKICRVFNVKSKEGPKNIEIMRIINHFEGKRTVHAYVTNAIQKLIKIGQWERIEKRGERGNLRWTRTDSLMWRTSSTAKKKIPTLRLHNFFQDEFLHGDWNNPMKPAIWWHKTWWKVGQNFGVIVKACLNLNGGKIESENHKKFACIVIFDEAVYYDHNWT